MSCVKSLQVLGLQESCDDEDRWVGIGSTKSSLLRLLLRYLSFRNCGVRPNITHTKLRNLIPDITSYVKYRHIAASVRADIRSNSA